ncbi:DUF6542 domain-containing protein [Blastococcus litoris]|uniref:DUF6542 domain-containing protein n=1 Tax=Blastococcus litoris TaxID=2171622 RepID=UPI000E3071FB|nr:DUF6542 domain-containing protein [Blastococcus litoris]
MSADRASRPQTSRRSEPPRPRADGPRGRVEDRYRPEDRYRDDDGYRSAPVERPRAAAPARERASARPADTRGGRVRGVVAVLGVFLVTLGGAAVDSFVGIGLGTITLGALVASTALATVLVRRRDVLSVVVAPPLVFLAVAGVNIALAPSASFTLPTVATLLVRGFPTMGIATAVAIVLALFRLVSRR